MTFCGDVATEEEPQAEDETAGEEQDDLGMDLLARARLLCQAANEIALPMLQSVQHLQDKFAAKEKDRKAKAKPSRPSTREDDEEVRREKPTRSKPASRKEPREKSGGASSKLPALVPLKPQPPPPGLLPHVEKRKAPVVKAITKKKKNTPEEDGEESLLPLPQINATGEWRKQREAEKIRQAQERAKARVLRKSNQVEQLPSKSNEQLESVEADNVIDSDEMQRLIETNRRRAEERVKQRKQQELADEQAKASLKLDPVPQQPSEETAKRAEAFRHRTLQRLQAAKREAQAQDRQPEQRGNEEPQGPTDESEQRANAEDAEKERKRLEKRRRRETAERLKRQQQVADEQQRKEQEIFERGLSEFKTKKKELDRGAKGIHPKRPQVDPGADATGSVPVVPPQQHGHPSSTLAVEKPVVVAAEENPHEPIVAFAVQSGEEVDSGPPAEELSLHLDREADQHQHTNPTSSGTKTRRQKKLPPWKQPPVPILPAECYSQKVILSPSDSYAERFQFRAAKTSPNVTSSATPSATFIASPTILARKAGGIAGGHVAERPPSSRDSASGVSSR